MTPDSHHSATYAWYEANAKKYFDAAVGINMTVLYVPFLAYMQPYASILDAGCGSGRDTLYFTQRGYKVTAFDYSPALVKMAAKLTGQPVLHLAFKDLTVENQFHGVWASYALVHVPMDDMHDVLFRLSRSMKVGGVMYTSFRYGTGETDRHGRRFLDLDEEGADELIDAHPELSVIRCWQTGDLRPDRPMVKWLNLLVRKARPTKRMTFLGVGYHPPILQASTPG